MNNIRCALPEAESGYNPHVDSGMISIAVGESRSFVCTDPAAESGDSQNNTHTITCQPDGTMPTGKIFCYIPDIILQLLQYRDMSIFEKFTQPHSMIFKSNPEGGPTEFYLEIEVYAV